MKIDINADLGESFGHYSLGCDSELLKHLTSANIACGFHAGDPLVMEETVRMAKENGTAVGAHPGFPDIMGFGRRAMKVTVPEIKAYTKYQLGALWAFAKSQGVKLQHIKPHGALYNMAAVDYELARAIADAVMEVDGDIIFLALANSQMVKAGKDAGLKVAYEVFADRAYNKDGTLTDRSLPGSMLTEPEVCAGRIVRMVKEGEVTAVTGEEIGIEAHSVCVHGDNPEAIGFVRKIREALEKAGIGLAPLEDLNL